MLKPPGWEVDTGGKCARPLSAFIQASLPEDRRNLALRPDFGFGFIHRLDTPSSGLILTATSFEGHACLEWQMYTYSIGREYVVLGHGLPVSTSLRIAERILDQHRAVVDDAGRPAQSHLHFVASARDLSLVAIRIRTGRRHQIRVHMRHCGSPSVADHRYCPDALFVRMQPAICQQGMSSERPCDTKVTHTDVPLDIVHKTHVGLRELSFNTPMRNRVMSLQP